MPRFPQTTLRGEGLLLRVPDIEDTLDIVAACRDVEIQRWLPLPRDYSTSDARYFVEGFARGELERGSGIVFVVESDPPRDGDNRDDDNRDDDNRHVLAAIDLKRTDWEAGRTEVGYWVAPWARGQGVATRAARLVTRFALAQGLARVTLRAATGNTASQRVARSAGFTFEGVARCDDRLRGHSVDHAVYAFTHDDLAREDADTVAQAPEHHDATAAASGASLTPGLPDAAFEHDGQLTKREIRAVTLAILAPRPGELLWDVGAGSGSVGIEWMRAHPRCEAFAIEPRAERAERIVRNARRLRAGGLVVVHGRAPDALTGLPRPDAVFVGGGLTAPGMLETCWSALPVGGRLVANTVTLESEALLAAWAREHGGDLTRLAVERALPVGSFTSWTPLRAVTTCAVTKR